MATGKITPEPNRRKLTTHQKAVLIQVLRTFPGECVRVCYSAAASGGQTYAEDFSCVFRAIGWDVEGPEADETASTTACGVALVVNEPEPPPCAAALRDALLIYGIEADVQCADAGKTGRHSFVLRVA